MRRTSSSSSRCRCRRKNEQGTHLGGVGAWSGVANVLCTCARAPRCAPRKGEKEWGGRVGGRASGSGGEKEHDEEGRGGRGSDTPHHLEGGERARLEVRTRNRKVHSSTTAATAAAAAAAAAAEARTARHKTRRKDRQERDTRARLKRSNERSSQAPTLEEMARRRSVTHTCVHVQTHERERDGVCLQEQLQSHSAQRPTQPRTTES